MASVVAVGVQVLVVAVGVRVLVVAVEVVGQVAVVGLGQVVAESLHSFDYSSGR